MIMAFPDYLLDIPIRNGLYEELDSKLEFRFGKTGDNFEYEIDYRSSILTIRRLYYMDLEIEFSMGYTLYDGVYATVKKNGEWVDMMDETTIRDLTRSNIKSANK